MGCTALFYIRSLDNSRLIQRVRLDGWMEKKCLAHCSDENCSLLYLPCNIPQRYMPDIFPIVRDSNV